MPSRNPKLTIGMPIYNAEDHASRAIESLLSQTFEDFELILSDNASEDKTGEICREYQKKDSRIRYYRNYDNLGASRNFNRVFQAALGEYFMWAAHDDRWDPTYAESCLGELDSNPDAVLCYSTTDFVNIAGETVRSFKDPFTVLQENPVERFLTIVANIDWCNSLYGVVRTKAMWLTDLIVRNTASSDNLLLAHLAFLGKFIQLDQPLFHRKYPQFPQENFEQRYARIYNMDQNLGLGITLPFLQLVKAHCDVIKLLPIDDSAKNHTIQQSVALLCNRYRQQINLELNRAIKLINAGFIRFNWGDPVPENPPVFDKFFLDFSYIIDLIGILEFVHGILPDFPGLHHARAVLFLMVKRPEEAKVALKKELARDPNFAPSMNLLRQLDPNIDSAADKK